MSLLTNLFSPPKPRATPVSQIDSANRDAAAQEAAAARRRIAARNNQQGLATGAAGLLGPTPVNRPTLKRRLGA